MRRLLTRTFGHHKFVVILAVIITIASYFGVTLPVYAQPTQPSLIASVLSFSGTRPENLGVTDGQFTVCPSSPNCVSSQSSDTEHYIDPLSYGADPTAAYEQLKMVVETLKDSQIITDNYPYLYAEFTTAFFGFIDDVEFYLDPDTNTIQVRSASRLGESDLGVNRRRVETIRAMFESFNS